MYTQVVKIEIKVLYYWVENPLNDFGMFLNKNEQWKYCTFSIILKNKTKFNQQHEILIHMEEVQ